MDSAHGFELLRETTIDELHSRARLYRHVATGAELLSLTNNDENKVFGVSFRTPPSDSTGLPHIMEHSVLCGSRKFPTKEPFVELLKGSLNTFLNAYTSADKTTYPVASTNLQDFYNLVDVYLDSVFHPRITPQILQQEGWHYELDDPDAPLSFKGVVFNEMKGASMSPDRQLYIQTQRTLLPDTIYAVDSGGDPAAIPDLHYEQFRRFHERYYHPSNARLFFYGDDPEDERLRLLDEYLSEFERQPVDSAIDLQPPFDEPQRVTRPYPVSETEEADKGMVVLSWLLGEHDDPERVLAWTVLDRILLGTPGSPLRKRLIESGLGEDLANHGLEGQRRQLVFSTGLKGVDVARADAVEALVLDTLRDLAEGGLERDAIEAALNTTEFTLRENNTGNAPRGLVVFNRALTTWLHGGDPLAPLQFEAPLAALQARLAAGEALFESLIREGLLDNPHRVTLVLEPDPDLTARLEAAERARLDAARAAMRDADVQRVIAETQALREAQAAPDPPDALARIPRLDLDDLERENKPIPLEVVKHQGARILYHDLSTNGIVYLDVALNLHALPQARLPYAPLFGRALLEMGTSREDYVRLTRRIDRETGGLRATTLTTAVRGSRRGEAWLVLRGKAMVPQLGELLAILRDVLTDVRLDNQDRFTQMVLEAKARREASLQPMGHRFINRRLRARFGEAAWATEQTGGVSQLFFVRELAQQVQHEWAPVHETLEELRRVLFNRHAMLLNVTVDGEAWDGVRGQLTDFLDEVPADPVELAGWTPTPLPDNEGLIIPARVNYVGKAANLDALGYELGGAALVVSRYLRTSWIWEQVRVQGGAYGGFSLYDPLTGIFSYLSYRDPNLLDTLAVYDRAGDFLRTLDVSEDELTKGIIGAIGDFDAYQLPDAKGYTSMERYLAHVTDEYRQRLREEILGTTEADFRALADALDAVKRHGDVVVMGPRSALEEASTALAEPLTLTPVL